MYLNAPSISPPEQPKLPYLRPAHSTSCSSDKSISCPLEIAQAPSTAPVAEKVQHEPHCPWSFTEVTAPLLRQSMAEGAPEAELENEPHPDDSTLPLIPLTY